MFELFNENILAVKVFLFHPEDVQENYISIYLKLKRLFCVLIIDICISIIIIVLISVLKSLHLPIPDSNKISVFIRMYPIWLILILSILLIPLFEEFLFRFGIRKKKFYPIQFPVFLIRLFSKNKSLELDNRTNIVWNNNYRKIFYSSAIAFALYHLPNYEINVWVIIFFPILIFPQFAIGLLSGYLRVKFSFIWGFLLHILHNTIFISLALLSLAGTSDRLNIKTKDYTLKISETRYTNLNYIFNTSEKIDSLQTVNLELNEIIPFLLNIDKQSIRYNSNMKSKTALTINYTSIINDRNANCDTIIKHLKKLYHFDNKTSSQICETWMLQIIDTMKLNKFISTKPLSSPSKMEISNYDFIFDNANLGDIIKYLSNHFKKFISMPQTSEIRFSLTFEAYNFEKFRALAYERYGLQFVSYHINTKITDINFNE